MDNDHSKVAKEQQQQQQYDFLARVAYTKVDCLSRYPPPSTFDVPLLDCNKGEVMAPTTFLAMMVVDGYSYGDRGRGVGHLE